jgi:hypothetical protein
VEVQEQSEVSLEFQTLMDCPMHVFVITQAEMKTYRRITTDHTKTYAEKQEAIKSFAKENAPENLRFLGANSGSGAAELSAGVHQIVFQRACELGERTAVEFTAEVEVGKFR